MRPVLNAQSASVTTVSVEINTLTVSGKQVTLAVFRQLPLETWALDGNAQWEGIPWGWVNYKLDDFDGAYRGSSLWPGDQNLKHVVFQEGDSLKRGFVVHPDMWFTLFDPYGRGPGKSGLKMYFTHLDRNGTIFNINNDLDCYERCYRDRWQELCDLPQLFIAV